MNYKMWADDLRRALERHGITGAEAQAVISYYDEIYSDKRDAGVSEADILKEFGFPEDVAINVVSDNENKSQAPDNTASEDIFEEIPSSKSAQDMPKRQPSAYTQPKRYDTYRHERSYRGCITLLALPLTLLVAFVGGIVMLALIGIGMALPIAGIALCVTSFFVMSGSFGAFLISLGSGAALFGAGCLLAICIFNLGRLYLKALKIGLGIRGGRA